MRRKKTRIDNDAGGTRHLWSIRLKSFSRKKEKSDHKKIISCPISNTFIKSTWSITNHKQTTVSTIEYQAWIAESYHTRLWSSVHWAMPKASVMTNSFSDPSTTSMLYSWFYLVWYYYLSVKFVMWIVKQKIENKRNLFFKKLKNTDRNTKYGHESL